VVNLRREDDPYCVGEEALAHELGLAYQRVPLSSVLQPPAPRLREVIQCLETMPRPLLLHCRSGADRAGVASVLAAMAVGGQDYDTARRQLSWRTLHVNPGTNRVVAVLQKYEAWCRDAGRPRAGWEQFRTWALSEYYPMYYHLEIGVPPALRLPPGQTQALDVRLTNRADIPIPASDPARRFTISIVAELAAGPASGPATNPSSAPATAPVRRVVPRLELPRQDIAPGQTITMQVPLQAPWQRGTWMVRFDAIEEDTTTFAEQGSPIALMTLEVR
jgi:hypothetical protein